MKNTRDASLLQDPAFIKERDERHRKGLNRLLIGSIAITTALLVLLTGMLLVNPTFFHAVDGQTLWLPCLLVLGACLLLLLMNNRGATLAATILFNVVILGAIVLGDTPMQVFHGRSFIYMLIPLVASALLIRPWAGYVVAGLITIGATVATQLMGIALPDIPGLIMLFFIAYLVHQATSEMEHSVARELLTSRGLRRSQDRYQKVTASSPNSIMIINLPGMILDCNEAAWKMYGAASREEMIGLNSIEIAHPKGRERASAIQEALRRDETWTESGFYFMRKDGSELLCDISMAILTDENNLPESIVITNQDITARVQAEAALRSSEENSRRMIESLPVGILVHQGGPIRLINPAGAKILGAKDPQEIIGTINLDYVHPDYLGMVHERIKTTLVEGENTSLVQQKLIRRDGCLIDVEVVGMPVQYDGKPSMLVMFQDITGRLRTEAEIDRQHRRIQEVSQLLANAQEHEKHLLASELHDDLGQSLTSLKLMLEFARTTPQASRRKETLENALVTVAELMGKVRSLSLDLRPDMLDDFGLVPALRWFFERFSTETGISVRSDLAIGKEQRFQANVETTAYRIIQEALTNIARHAGVKQAGVKITRKKDELIIEVVDQGGGFELHSASGEEAPTSGIPGMQERARLVGGRVEVRSTPGSGTRVVARLPLERGAA